ncbi:RNF4 ligase, partial [Cephalopterus ornatus]|nr:RNF4 ligase [Cephalopterus ornatus]
RKRRGGDVNSGQASKRSRLLPSSAGEPSTAEPRDLEESAVDEIIDLTNESSQSEVIDLTGDDSDVQGDQNEERPHVSSAADDSVVLLVSDDEEEPRDDDGYVTDKVLQILHVLFAWCQCSSKLEFFTPNPSVRCPICMDFYSQIVQGERQIVSTLCGHLFCSRCLPVALETARACPTCRTELYPDAYHPIFF